MDTIKLYDQDSHLIKFDATVLECNKVKDGYGIVLDRTAFFPEGGGQFADTGIIGFQCVHDVQISNGTITHYTSSPFDIGQKVDCSIDYNTRFRRMQNHSGEHILSGLVYKLYGFDNVGFHLSDEVTVDFNGELSAHQLYDLESLANQAIFKNVPVITAYPSSDELKKIKYRSKLDLDKNVRIVTIKGYDTCACCAPHVSRTGEIGIIKIIDSMRHRGGTRVHILCGYDALDDYRIKQNNLSEISKVLCSKQNECSNVFSKFHNDSENNKKKITDLKKSITKLKIQNLSPIDGNMIFFENDLDNNNLRALVLAGAKMCDGLCAGFSGNNNDGYNYVIASYNIALSEISNNLNAALSGKGGGSDGLIQGSLNCKKSQIDKFFKELS